MLPTALSSRTRCFSWRGCSECGYDSGHSFPYWVFKLPDPREGLLQGPMHQLWLPPEHKGAPLHLGISICQVCSFALLAFIRPFVSFTDKNWVQRCVSHSGYKEQNVSAELPPVSVPWEVWVGPHSVCCFIRDVGLQKINSLSSRRPVCDLMMVERILPSAIQNTFFLVLVYLGNAFSWVCAEDQFRA